MSTYPRRSYTKPKSRYGARQALGDAAKALAIARGIKKLINVEVKNFDVQQGGVSLTQTPVIVQLSNIAQGDGTNQRDGAQCKMVGIDLNFVLTQNASATQTFVRVMLILDKQTNQAIYLPADLLEDVTGGDNIVTPRNLDNLKRFTILYDRSFEFSGDGNRSAIVKKYIKKEVLLRYDGSTPSIADLTQSSISFIQMASEATNTPTITHFSRLRFIDN